MRVDGKQLTQSQYIALLQEMRDDDYAAADPYVLYVAYQCALQAAAPQAAPPPRPLDAAPLAKSNADPLAAARQVEGVERQVLSPYGQWLEECECL